LAKKIIREEQGMIMLQHSTVASRPKILQNNSKPALERSDWPGEFGGRTATVFGQKRQKTGRNKYFLKKCRIFSHLAEFFQQICHQTVLGPGNSAAQYTFYCLVPGLVSPFL
jgi:hypothetical protein